jgi:hypothetical protein
LTDADFATLDKNGDELLSLAELEAQLQPTTGCCEAGTGAAKLERYLGDFFLLGVALMTLLGWTALGRKH